MRHLGPLVVGLTLVLCAASADARGRRPPNRTPPAPKPPSIVVKAKRVAPITVTLLKNGTLVVKQRGRTLSHKVAKSAPTKDRRLLRGRVVEVKQFGKRYRVLHFRAGGKFVLEAAIWLRGRKPVVIFAGVTGPQGVDKEWSRHLEVKSFGVRLYQRTRGLWRCDGVRAEMLPRGYHFKSRRLLPVLLPVPDDEGAVTLTATPTGPAGVTANPLAPFRFRSASSEVGCGGRAKSVSPPSELHDNRPRSAWIEGWGGPGVGEYVTGEAVSGDKYRVRAIRILPGHGRSAETWKQLNRLKTVFLLLGKKLKYKIHFPTDPAFGVPQWVVLPKPVRTKCLTMVLWKVYRGTQKNASTAVSEVSVFTDLDFGNRAAAQILKDVGAGKLDRLEAVRILLRLGKAGAAKLRKAFPKAASAAEREVLLRVLARLDPVGSLKELATGLREARGVFRGQLLRALAKVGDPAVPAFGKLLGMRLPEKLEQLVVYALASVGTRKAAAELVSSLKRGGRRLRGRVVNALTILPRDRVQDPVFKAVGNAKLSGPVRADLLRVVRMLVIRHPTLASRAKALVPGLLQSETRFAVRYRVLELVQRLADPLFVKPLGALLASPLDAILREQVVLALGHIRDPAARALVAKTLSDRSPRVRAGAATAWSLGAAGAAQPKVLSLATSDPWPLVRTAAARALAKGCRGKGDLLALARKRTSWRYKVVRRIGLTAAYRCKVKGLRPLLRKILTSDREYVPLRALSARLLGELKDATEVRYMREFLILLSKRVARPQSRNEVLAAALALALGRIGDKRAVGSLIKASRVTRLPHLRAASLEALGYFCAPRSRKAVVAAQQSTSRLVVQTARRTRKRCKW